MRSFGLAVALIAMAVPNSASADNYAPCRSAATGGVHSRYKPRHCTLGGEAHYQQAPLIKLRWRRWSGGFAIGRGRFIYNMGFNRPVWVKLYRREWWDEDSYVFRRARICIRGFRCHSMRLP